MRLTESRPERVKTLESVQAAIQHRLLLQNQKDLEAEWKRSARTIHPAEVHTHVLAGIQAPAAPRPEAGPPKVP